MDAFLASLGLPMPAAAAAAAAPPAESAFVRQVIHVVDMRRLLFTFLEWDEVIGLAPVCKATAALVSGRSATSVERNEAIVRFVLEPLLSTTLQHYITWDYAAPAHEQGERAAKRYADFEAWRALPHHERLLCLDESLVEIPGPPDSDLPLAIEQIRKVMRHHGPNGRTNPLPLHEIMKMPVLGLSVATRNGHMQVGSVIRRVMWHLGRYPHWMRYLLASPDADRAKKVLGGLPRPEKYHPTPLSLLPSDLSGEWRRRKHLFDYTREPKPLKVALERDINTQNAVMETLLGMYKRYTGSVEAKVRADLLLPKLYAMARGGPAISTADALDLIDTLKRASTSDGQLVSAHKRSRRSDGSSSDN